MNIFKMTFCQHLKNKGDLSCLRFIWEVAQNRRFFWHCNPDPHLLLPLPPVKLFGVNLLLWKWMWEQQDLYSCDKRNSHQCALCFEQKELNYPYRKLFLPGCGVFEWNESLGQRKPRYTSRVAVYQLGKLLNLSESSLPPNYLGKVDHNSYLVTLLEE